ncbi:cystathionine gamma-synthase [Klebsormidium nitens]|uniref:plant cystathionine gamma-synthase n=1 Tax=Klebsormidium nitens TaxID=105231 RepID=A0A1Y1HPV3_KLENI|nr:cystathionine gamma-synthase [Klebsormidium nitens]|eukprot:GAQ80664.1 cystathionine gamma-synthase [Klebsormidium nitens]
MAAVAAFAETITAPSISIRAARASEAKHAFCSAVLLKRQERCQFTGASRRAAGRAYTSPLKRSIERVAPAGFSWSHNWNRGSYGKEKFRAQTVATDSIVSGNGAAGAEEDLLASALIDANGSSVIEDCGKGLPEKRQATNAVHGGERREPFVTDALTTPIVQTATYTFKDTAQLIAFQDGTHSSYEYGRYGNPTTRVVEQKISALEGAEDTLVSSSGMNSATTMLLALVPDGGHIVTTTDCYRRTRQFIQTVLPRMGISTTVIDPSDMASLERTLDEHDVTLFFSESPTNPYLRCIDIELVSQMCHERGTLVCIDGTFATPINQQAIPLGADLVLHSATKYLAGHQDVLAGSLSGRKPEVAKVRQLHNVLGGVVDSHAAYLILRGMKTLDLRVHKQNQTALRLAEALESHPKISRVHYPGLTSHPEHDIARRQMKGYGGVVSFEINGDLWRTAKFIDSLRLPYIAPSLGGVESLVEQPTIISYWDYGPEERARLGIKDNLVRFSCGIEDYDDIAEDMFRGLDSI